MSPDSLSGRVRRELADLVELAGELAQIVARSTDLEDARAVVQRQRKIVTSLDRLVSAVTSLECSGDLDGPILDDVVKLKRATHQIWMTLAPPDSPAATLASEGRYGDGSRVYDPEMTVNEMVTRLNDAVEALAIFPQAPLRKAKIQRDPAQMKRDALSYHLFQQGKSEDTITNEVNDLAKEKGWETAGRTAIMEGIDRHITDNDLPPRAPRKRGRRSKA